MNISQWIIAHFLEITGYLLAIILIPFIGVPLYFLIGGKRTKRISREKDWGMRNMGASAQDPDDVEQVTRVIEGMLRQSRQVSKEEVEQKSKIREFSEDICRDFSPLL